MILELHCHTAEHSSCSNVAAVELVQRNFDMGLQGTVLTDHHYLWSQEEIAELRSRLSVPDYYLVLSGQEVYVAELGDVLVYGADTSIEKDTSVADIRKRFPGAAIIWAHPYRNENIPAREKLLHPLINAVEIFNSNHTVAESSRGLRDWHDLKFTAVGGTDAHALTYAGLYPTIFDHPVSTVAELAREIREGRCRPFLEEIPLAGTSSTRVTEITIRAANDRNAREKYVIKKHNHPAEWHSAERTVQIMKEVRKHGFAQGRFRVPEPLGDDRESLTVIEQGIEGKTLFDALTEAEPAEAADYLEMTAEWLARLHNCRLRITPPEEFFSDEPLRLERYMSAFYKIKHRHTRKAQEIMDKVIEAENSLYCTHQEKLIQGHGDFHPKNIFIGQDSGNASFRFVAAIDFYSSYSMPQAFDVGTFLAQFRNQFYDKPGILAKVPENLFLKKYMHEAKHVDQNFLMQIDLFRARTSLSICYYLIKVGLGDSENLWRVLVEAEHRLARLSMLSIDESV
jgi:thiamine kinase-like enzyme/predicted metal-dependent phosphoesterase TrpH